MIIFLVGSAREFQAYSIQRQGLCRSILLAGKGPKSVSISKNGWNNRVSFVSWGEDGHKIYNIASDDEPISFAKRNAKHIWAPAFDQ